MDINALTQSGGLSLYNANPSPTGLANAFNKSTVVPDWVNDPKNIATGQATMPRAAASAAANAAQSGTINSVYDQRIGRLQGMLGQLDPRQTQAADQYLQGFNNNASLLEDARNRGLRNIDVAQQNNDQGKVRSFRDIATGIRGSIDAFRNQLGTMNASDSSASDMGAYAFSKLQTQQRGNVLDTYNQNATQLDIGRQDIEGDFRNQLNTLKFEKDNAIRGIADKFAAIRQQIADEIAQSDEARAFELANLGQQYTMQAMKDVQALDAQFQQTSNDLVSRYTSMMPKVNTAIANPNVQQGAYSTYGRTYAPQINSFSGADEATVAPMRRREIA